MRKVYKSLTDDQKARGVIFSSQLLGGGTIHEVFRDQYEGQKIIERLLDDKFFNGSHYKANEIRQ